MKIEIVGADAITATEELLTIAGLQGNYETIDEVERDGTLATIATILTIIGEGTAIAKQLAEWIKKNQTPLSPSGQSRVEKVIVVSKSGKRLRLKETTTLDEIKDIIKEDLTESP